VVAATNFEEALDSALWRRFDEIMRFERPSLEQAELLLKRRLAYLNSHRVNLRRSIDALKGYSFSDIDRIALDVSKTCALEGRSSFTEADLAAAVQKQVERRAILTSVQSTTPRVTTP
jgi:SpoVK/Ycf46/Vps4 family AAA+-type ATPase